MFAHRAAVVADPTKTRVGPQLKHDSPFISCRMDPQGEYVWCGTQNCTLVRLKIADGAAVSLSAHDSWTRAIGFSLDGAEAYSAAYDGKLIWWEATAETPAVIRTVQAHEGWVRALTVSRDGQWIFTVGNDNLAKQWSAADGSLVREFAGHESHVYNVALHPDGEQMATMDLKGFVKHWSLADGKVVRELHFPELHKYDTTFKADIGGARSIDFDPAGKLLACGGISKVSNAFAGVGNPAVSLIDWEKGEQVHLLKPKEDTRGVAWGARFHPDGYLIAAVGGGSGGFLYFFKPTEPNQFHELKLPNTARDLDLHLPTQRLAVAHFDNTVRLYEMSPPEKS